MSKPEVPHHPWRVITETRTSGCWPTEHDGLSDRMSDKSDIGFSTRTGDRSLTAPTCQRQEGLSAFRGQTEICNCNCV